MTVPTEKEMAGYGQAAPQYLDAGWRGVVPIRRGGKRPDVRGYHGNKGKYPSAKVVANWCRSKPTANVALRLEDGFIGIDVDAYAPKIGGETLAETEATYGSLPPTWRSTSRPDDSVSGIRWFKVPKGRRWCDLGGDVETICWYWRYAVVWPSVVERDDTEHQYVWFDPSGNLVERVPSPDEFPELPAAWVERLTKPDPSEQEPATLSPIGKPQTREVTDRAAKWAEAGFTAEVAKVTATTANRNDQLNASAYKQGRKVAGGLLDAERVRSGLIDASNVLSSPQSNQGCGGAWSGRSTGHRTRLGQLARPGTT
jgi:hypothetical protein